MPTRRSALSILAAAPLVMAGIVRLDKQAKKTGPWRPGQKHPLSGNHRALVIGCDKYQAVKPLERAVADSSAVAARLRDYGFDVFDAPDSNLAAVIQTVDRFLAAIKPGDMTFLFFACHGVQVHGRNFLLMRDADVSSESALRNSALDLPALFEKVGERNPAKTIALLDACRTNVFDQQSSAVNAGLGSAFVPAGFYIGYSASNGESALDRLSASDSDPNGVFTRALLRNLHPDASFDAVVKRTRTQVIRSAGAIGRAQHPAIYDQSGEDITVMGGKPTFQMGGVVDTGVGVPVVPTAALLIGVLDYGRADLPRLVTPAGDVKMIGEALEANGIATEKLINPSYEQVERAIGDLAHGPAKRLILYFAGHGGYVDGDAALFLPGDGANAVKVQAAGGVMVSGLTLERIATIAAATEGSWLRKQLLVLFDSSLGMAKPGDKKGFLDGLVLHPANDSYRNLAFLGAARIDQQALDEQEGAGNSPFAIALGNALARPGMTLFELGRFISTEVVGMTDGNQEPELYADPTILCSKLTRLAPVREALGPSSGPIIFGAPRVSRERQDEEESRDPRCDGAWSPSSR